MTQNRDIFRVEAPEGLKSAILHKISLAEKRSLRSQLFLFSFGTLVSFSALIYAGFSLVHSFAQTGFSQYLSLIFSSDGSIIAFWKEITYSLAESMPMLGTAGFLFALALLVWLSANAFTSARKFVWAQ